MARGGGGGRVLQKEQGCSTTLFLSVKAFIRLLSTSEWQWMSCLLLQLQKPFSPAVTVTSFPLHSLTCAAIMWDPQQQVYP
ncbi:unnamed protein product [Sphagnum jensenii]|uniref:Uncharacterized protein n=1 Tax=Sphagnum jensenii TaxID=128206 RepID=A0ABP0X6T8_9BRYO